MREPTQDGRAVSIGDRRRFYSVVVYSAIAVVILSLMSIGIARSRLAETERDAASAPVPRAQISSSPVSLARSRPPEHSSASEGEPALPYTETTTSTPAGRENEDTEVWVISGPTVVSRGSQQVFVGGTAMTGRVIRATARRVGSAVPCSVWIELGTYLPLPRMDHPKPRYELTGYWEIVGPNAAGPGSENAIKGRFSGVYRQDPLLMERLTARATLLVPTMGATLAPQTGSFVGTGQCVGRLTIPRPMKSPIP